MRAKARTWEERDLMARLEAAPFQSRQHLCLLSDSL
jgi:hypothetical protein